MRNTVKLAAVLGCACLSVPSMSIVWRSDRTADQILAFGQDARFAGVGLLSVDGSFGTATFIGTGNGSAWLITAKHVIDTGQTGTFQFYGGPTFNVTDAWGLAGADIAVAKIVNWNLNVFTPTLNLGTIVDNTHTVCAGYGGSGPESQGGGWAYDDKRRGMETNIVGYDGSNYVEDRFDAPGDPYVTYYEGFGASGDSGSSLIDDYGRILGVLSGGDFEQYGGYNYYAALTADRSQAIYTHTGISPVPEPATMAALGLGFALLIRRRRSR
jgi:hypothetical protein